MASLKTTFRHSRRPAQVRSVLKLALTSLALSCIPHLGYAQTIEEPLVLDPNGQPIDAFNQNPNPLSQLEPGRQNLPAETSNVTGSINPLNVDDGSAPGLRFGSFTLRPSIQTQILYENEKNGATKQSRTYNQTDISVTLESDWSRHSLNITANGLIQENISGDLQESPSANIDAELELDLSNTYTATLAAGYNLSVENSNDPNAIAAAQSQAKNHRFEGSLALAKDVGVIRGTLTGSIGRDIFGDAKLSNGQSFSRAERDFTDHDITLRLSFGGEQALRPFIESGYGRTIYDQKIDDSGIERSFTSYSLRLGTEIDLGEKAAGEFAVGYSTNDFDDSSLDNIDIFTLDGNINWSPNRGTNLNLALNTELEPSTSSNSSGSALYAVTAGLTHEIANNWDVNLNTNYALRDYTDVVNTPNQYIYGAGLGLDWSVNRYLSMNADATYSKTIQENVPDIDNWTVGLGLTLSR